MTGSVPRSGATRTVNDTLRQRLRLALPLLLLTGVIGAMGVFAYRSLAEEIRRETHRTLTVIAEQKAQGAPDSAELKNAVREELIRRELLLQEAKKSGIDK